MKNWKPQTVEATLLSHLSSLQSSPPPALYPENEEVNKSAKPRCHVLTAPFSRHHTRFSRLSPCPLPEVSEKGRDTEKGIRKKKKEKLLQRTSAQSAKLEGGYRLCPHQIMDTEPTPERAPHRSPRCSKLWWTVILRLGPRWLSTLFHLSHHFAANKSSPFLRCGDIFFYPPGGSMQVIIVWLILGFGLYFILLVAHAGP